MEERPPGRAKRIYWAVKGILTSPQPGTMAALWAERTAGTTIPKDHFETVVYFADGPVNLYQVRQWYEPLRQLNEQSPTVVMCRSTSSALALLDECPVPVVCIPKIEEIERFVNEQRLRMAIYVNHHQRNFQLLRFINLLHVYVSHGESDKHYMVSGQIKAYDYTFIAGKAAAARLGRFLLNYDVASRTKTIGRPQLDVAAEADNSPTLPADDRLVVFYAPTWEGDRASMGYGSIASHGVTMVKTLLGTGRHRVIVRPHPRTGLYSSEQQEGRALISQLITEANAADPQACHLFDETPNLDWQLKAADVAISDVSAAAIDWLATGKPLVVTKPSEPGAVLPSEGYLSELELLPVTQAADIAQRLDAALTDEQAAQRRRRWATYYFGDATPGVATKQWLNACQEVIAAANAELARRGRLPADVEPETQSDVDDDSA